MTDAGRIAASIAPLAFDTLALAIALCLHGIAPLRPAVVFALFEGVMPAIGATVGIVVGSRYTAVSAYIGAAILIGLRVHARETSEIEDEAKRLSFVSQRSTALAGFAISIDELVVGFPIGSAGLPVPAVLLAIANQAFGVTLIGVTYGRRLGASAARAAGVCAGTCFILLASWILIEQLSGS